MIRVALQIDPIDTLVVERDSSLYLIKEAIYRGYHVSYFTPDNLAITDGYVFAIVKDLAVIEGRVVAMGEPYKLNLDICRYVLIRQNPPFDMNYVTNCYILSHLKSCVTINDAKAIIDLPEKLSIFAYREFLPDSVVTKDPLIIYEMFQKHERLVLKDLYGYGGNDVMLIDKSNAQEAISLMLLKANGRQILAQEFLPEIANGDVRGLIMHGKVVGAFSRVPREGEFRSNMAFGASIKLVDLTQKQQKILEILAKDLYQKKITLAGIDFIGDYLTEVNVTSPTGYKTYAKIAGAKISEFFWDQL